MVVKGKASRKRRPLCPCCTEGGVSGPFSLTSAAGFMHAERLDDVYGSDDEAEPAAHGSRASDTAATPPTGDGGARARGESAQASSPDQRGLHVRSVTYAYWTAAAAAALAVGVAFVVLRRRP